MIKVKIDMNAVKNHVAIIRNEAFTALSKNDKDRRDALARVIEQLKTLEQRLGAPEVEIN